MRNLARESERERLNLFRATAQHMRVHEAIIEKDFWVCWVLDYLFDESPWKDKLVFKGGTSLSKAYGAIERFSEDIDLVLDWRVLGYSGAEPMEARSATKQQALGQEANRRTEIFIKEAMIPVLIPNLSDRSGAEIRAEVDGQTALIEYPRAASLPVLQPAIRLEIGPMAAWVPHHERPIRPYAAEIFPRLFEIPQTTVRTIAAERTFWEKATILHKEAHRPPGKAMPLRYSRHYYDLYRLSRLPIRESAVTNLNLLQEVVEFKNRFYPQAWANYSAAKPGSLRLLPAPHNESALKADYAGMQTMLFGVVPSFDEIMAGLGALEQEINGLKE